MTKRFKVQRAANDNEPAALFASISNKRNEKARIRIRTVIAARCRFKDGEHLAAIPVKIIDSTTGGYAIGLKVVKREGACGRVVARQHFVDLEFCGLFARSFRGVHLPIHPVDDGLVLLARFFGRGRPPRHPEALPRPKAAEPERFRVIPEYLRSLQARPGAGRRQEFLAGERVVRNTASGDECYTARYFAEMALRAAGRQSFCLDVCSMNPKGKYLKVSPGKVICDWQRTPEQFRDPAMVLGPIPAERYFTNDAPYGSLARDWRGDTIWLNPPYALRAWATFLEKADYEVAMGHAGLVIALVPMDNSGEHIETMMTPHAHRIELVQQVPFFKPHKQEKSGVVIRNLIEPIRGNQVVVFGKKASVRPFLRRYLPALLLAGYITEQQCKHYFRQFRLGWLPAPKRDVPVPANDNAPALIRKRA